MTERIYFDNAATSWPKPESVYAALEHAQRNLGGSAGRGSHSTATNIGRIIDVTRNRVAQLIQAADAKSIAFTFSGTDSLCTAILGLLRDGDHVVTSTAEHNSVLRPLRHLEDEQRITVTRVECDAEGRIDAGIVVDAIQSNTRMVVLSHVSNVTGAIQPLELIGQHCRRSGILFVVDAAQSLGLLPINVNSLGCDILAAPGHKGLFGSLGTGVLYFAQSAGEQMNPLRIGGTGSAHNSDRQPIDLPTKFEAGNLNVPGIASIGAGIEFLHSEHGAAGLENLEVLKRQLLTGLKTIPTVMVHGPAELSTSEVNSSNIGSLEFNSSKVSLRGIDSRMAIFSITMPEIDCHTLANILDTEASIETRAGFHCAPLLHRSIGTEPLGGTLRISPGPFNTPAQIDRLLELLAAIV